MPGVGSGDVLFHLQRRWLAAGWFKRPGGWNFTLWTLPDLKEVRPFEGPK